MNEKFGLADDIGRTLPCGRLTARLDVVATTAESVHDALRWVGRFLHMAARRAAIMGVLIALFAAAAWWTTRDIPSDCGGVTAEQRAALLSLRQPDPSRRFRAASDPACVEGRYVVDITGLSGATGTEAMETVTDELVADGMAFDVEFLPFFATTWRRCFRFPDPSWDRIELNVWGTRDGRVHAIDASAPEEGDACDFLRY